MKQALRNITISLAVLLMSCLTATAQIGEYRNVFSVGVGGGYALNTIGFQPIVTQTMHGGTMAGLAIRYTTEKYFSTLCAVQMEMNIAQLGWKQDIITYDNTPVINPETGVAEEYKRDITYIQIPIFAHLSWGKEKKGVCGFINLGPQLGIAIGDKTTKNYDNPFTKENFPDSYSTRNGRISRIVEQESMPVENKFDYGIAVGAGIEAHINHVGRFALEGRYYYGLGNIYGDSKRDMFGRSNNGTIYIRLGYFYDL